MRMKRLLRGLCSRRLSGHSYLAIGGFIAALAVAIPVAGTTLAPIILAAAALIAGLFIITVIGVLLGPAIL